MEKIKFMKCGNIIIVVILLMCFFSNAATARKGFPKKFQKKGIRHGQWKPDCGKEGNPYTIALKVGNFEYERFRNEVGEKIISKSNELQFTPFKKLIIR